MKQLLTLSFHSDAPFKGIPDFWLQVLKSYPLTAGLIEAHDEHILNHLNHIDLELSESKPYQFVLKFYFSRNEYFSDYILNRTSQLRSSLDENFPFVYDYTDIERSTGCEISWKRGKDVTMKRSNDGETETIQYSFFNIFSTNERLTLMDTTGLGLLARTASVSSDSTASKDSNSEDLLNMGLVFDHELALTFKDKIIPHAILYYTGDLIEFDEPRDFVGGSIDKLSCSMVDSQVNQDELESHLSALQLEISERAKY